MIIVFIAASFIIGLFFSIIWSTSTLTNAVIKMFWILYTLTALLILFNLIPSLTLESGIRVI